MQAIKEVKKEREEREKKKSEKDTMLQSSLCTSSL